MYTPDNLIEKKELRDKGGIFRDRLEAGDVLAEMLAPEYAGIENGLVLAIPAGGVPLGLRLQISLDLPLDLIIIRKIQIPGTTEAGFGALSQTGDILLNHELLKELRLTREEMDMQIEKTRRELERKNELFRAGKGPLNLKDKRVIITDDGLASGYSMLSAVRMVKKHGPMEVVVAVPTAPLSSVIRVGKEADRIFSAHVQGSGSFAVANAYRYWHDLSEEEVKEMLGN